MGTLFSPEELKEHALKFLQERELMVLGTSLDNLVWSATVYYVATDEFELIFYSRPDTRHAENIEVNPNVSAVITEIPVKNHKNRSVQIAGLARKIEGAEWNHYYSLYEKKIKQASKYPDHIIYLVNPVEIWMINEKIFGHFNRIQVF